jgi:Zn ribbon nucleic-acid-binding protein
MQKDAYVIRVDKVCDYCGAKNEINIVVYDPIDVIACGKCGKLFLNPDDLSREDSKNLDKIINKAIKGE